MLALCTSLVVGLGLGSSSEATVLFMTATILNFTVVGVLTPFFDRGAGGMRRTLLLRFHSSFSFAFAVGTTAPVSAFITGSEDYYYCCYYRLIFIYFSSNIVAVVILEAGITNKKEEDICGGAKGRTEGRGEKETVRRERRERNGRKREEGKNGQ